jgi:hypothetical protein
MSFCQGIHTPALLAGAIEPCGGQIAIVVLPSGDEGTVFLYGSDVDGDDPSTYTLYAVVEHSATSNAGLTDQCVAGPTTLPFEDSCFASAEEDFSRFTCPATGALPLNTADGSEAGNDG